MISIRVPFSNSTTECAYTCHTSRSPFRSNIATRAHACAAHFENPGDYIAMTIFRLGMPSGSPLPFIPTLRNRTETGVEQARSANCDKIQPKPPSNSAARTPTTKRGLIDPVKVSIRRASARRTLASTARHLSNRQVQIAVHARGLLPRLHQAITPSNHLTRASSLT